MQLNDVCRALGRLAPLHLAQTWDNVGLLVGDQQAACARVLLTIDLTHAVLDEALQHRTDLLLAYHPPLFKPLATVCARGPGSDTLVWRAIRHNMAIYSMHTALDAAAGGTNEVLAGIIGATDLQPFAYINDNQAQFKIVVFMPEKDVDAVADALSNAGAGRIGDYQKCSFRIPGTGTFRGAEQTSPHIGEAGKFETVREIRVEMVAPPEQLPTIVEAIHRAHPYEEPAYDIYPLQPAPVPGIGRCGRLTAPRPVADLAAELKARVPAQAPLIVGRPFEEVDRVAICVGAAGSLTAGLELGASDCLISGEIRHHDALRIDRQGSHAIALGHWASERPVLDSLAIRLQEALPDLEVRISQTDRDPFQPID